MGFIARLTYLMRPRVVAQSGRLWDNVNTPGGVGAPLTRGSNLLPLIREPGPVSNTPFLPFPNPEFYLHGGGYANPERLHGQPDTLTPVIPYRVPTTDIGGTQVYVHARGAVANPTVLPQAGSLKAVAPSRVTGRDVVYDGATPHTLREPQAYTESQRYFNESDLIPEHSPPSRRIHGVYTAAPLLRAGWSQVMVPEPGMAAPAIGAAPPWFLNREIHATTDLRPSVEGHRSTIKKTRAPKRTRTGG